MVPAIKMALYRKNVLLYNNIRGHLPSDIIAERLRKKWTINLSLGLLYRDTDDFGKKISIRV